MIPFENRFHGHKVLSYLYENCQTVRGKFISIKYVKNNHRQKSRVVVIISKKTLKSAVKRNLIRRRFYEYLRLQLPKINNIYDLAIIISSSEALQLSYRDLSSQVDELLKQAQIIKK